MSQRFTDVRYTGHADPVHTVYFSRSAGDSQHVRYARIVVENSVRRQREPWGEALFNAVTSQASIDGAVEPLQATNEAVMAALTHLCDQIRRSTSLVPRLAPEPQSGPAIPPFRPLALPPELIVKRAEQQVLHAVLPSRTGRTVGCSTG